MKRDIKFRGLRVDNNKWVYGSFIHNSIDCECIIDINAEQFEVIPESVGQFTGLKDKNGVEIYEGDICRVLYTDWASNTNQKISLEDYLISISKIGILIWDYNQWKFQFKNKYGEGCLGSTIVGRYGFIEVIGNIYEHKHLLES